MNQIRKAVDNALLQGNATAGITGLIPQAGTTIKHSRFVADGDTTSTSTTVTSATAAFTSADVGSFVTGAGIPAGATIASVTNATTVVISAAATATATGVTLTITTNYAVYDRLVDALTAAQDAYADPKFWIINSQTIGVLRKLKDTQGHPLLSPDTTQQGAEMILGRTVLPAPTAALPHGVAMLVDPRTIHVAVDLMGYLRIALEAFISNDQVGLLVVSRFDAGVTIPAGLGGHRDSVPTDLVWFGVRSDRLTASLRPGETRPRANHRAVRQHKGPFRILRKIIPCRKHGGLTFPGYCICRDHRRCYLCGGMATEVNHVRPRFLGGGDGWENLRAVCHSCHAAKTAREAAMGRRRT